MCCLSHGIRRDRAEYVTMTTHAQVEPQRASADTFNPIMVTMETHTHTPERSRLDLQLSDWLVLKKIKLINRFT